MQFAGFDWDDGNWAKCQRHGVSIVEIERLLSGEPQVAPDVAHSEREDRFIAVGRDTEDRAMFVAFTIRIKDGRALVSPISARFMHEKESSAYAAKSPEAKN